MTDDMTPDFDKTDDEAPADAEPATWPEDSPKDDEVKEPEEEKDE
jgi:hypothetical protein